MKKSWMLLALFLLLASKTVHADRLEGTWFLDSYEVENIEIPVSGLMIFADGHFAMVYTMDYGGRSGRGHGGQYSLEGDEITYRIPWWVELVAGKSQVMQDEIEAKGRVEQRGDLLVIRFASGSVQKFHRAGK